MLNVQDRVSNEQEEQANEKNAKTTQVDYSSFCEDVAVALVFFARLWVVESVISFHVFWKQE